MITRRGLFAGFALALASVAGVFGLGSTPQVAEARRRRRRRKKHY